MIDLPFDYTPLRKEGESNRDLYWRYVFERQAIWWRRNVLALLRPWTNDETLQKYSFTNAYRELDRGTIHFANVAWPLIAQCDPAMQLWWTIVYRWFNRPEVWDNVLSYWCQHYRGEMNGRIEHMFDAVREWGSKNGVPVWTGAYMVCAYHGSPGYDKIDRVRRFCATIYNAIDPLYAAANLVESTEQFHRQLMGFDGIGPLNAYEVMSDLLMMKCEPFHNVARHFTEDDWANPGPGAEKGLRLVFGPEERYTRPRMQEMMRELRDEQRFAFADLGLPFADIALDAGSILCQPRWLTMRNIEHNLCEVFKYHRGSCRSKFTPRPSPTYVYGVPVEGIVSV